jgi:hypothetical protein
VRLAGNRKSEGERDSPRPARRRKHDDEEEGAYGAGPDGVPVESRLAGESFVLGLNGVPVHFEPAVNRELSRPGESLDSATRVTMERAFGKDLGNVRVHTDRVAGDSAQQTGSRAYTVGDQIVFGPSQFAPHTTNGRRLLAHELAHVVQQGAGSASGARPTRNQALESAADRAAVDVLHGGNGVSVGAPAAVGLAMQQIASPRDDAMTRAAAIYDAFHNIESYEVEEALAEIQDEPYSVLLDITRAYEGAHGSGSLMADFKEYGSPEEFKQALTIMRPVLLNIEEHPLNGATSPEARESASEAEVEPADVRAPATEPESAGEPAPEPEAAAEPEPAPEPEAATGPELAAATEPATGPEPAAATESAEGVAAVNSEPAEQPTPATSLEVAAAETEPPAGESIPEGPATPPPAEPDAASSAVAAGIPPEAADPAVEEVAPALEPPTEAAKPAAEEAPAGEAVSSDEADLADAGTEAEPAGETATAEASAPSEAGEPTTAEASAPSEAGEPTTAEALAPAEAAEPTIAEAQVPQPAGSEEPPEFSDEEAPLPSTPAGGVDSAGSAEPSEPAEPDQPPEADLVVPEPVPESPAGPVEPEPAGAAPADVVPAEAVETEAAVPEAESSEVAAAEAPQEAAPAETEATSAEPEQTEAPESEPVRTEGAEAGLVPEEAPSAPAEVGAEAALEDPAAPSGGGGGGAPIPDPPIAPVPDVSAMQPRSGLAAVAGLPATRLAASLAGVRKGAKRSVDEGRAELAANPPSLQRPSGIPADRDASLPPAELPSMSQPKQLTVKAVPTGGAAPAPQPAAPAPAPPPVTAGVPEPRVDGEAPITAEDAATAQAAVHALPTTDPGLNVDAGPVPELELTGDNDPKHVRNQATEVESTTAAAREAGIADARAPMGENDVYPHVPDETLTATLEPEAPTADGAAESAAAGTAEAPAGAETAAAGEDPTVDAVAAEQGSDKITGATQQQGAALESARTEHDASAQRAREETDRQINEEVARNAGEQNGVRSGARTEVDGVRSEWVGEQESITNESRQAADRAKGEADAAIDKARTASRDEAAGHIRDANEEIGKERQKAEQTAREERAKAERETSNGGILGWLGSKVKSFFDGVRKAIGAAFELARKAVDGLVKTAQNLAVAAIEVGRKAVVAAIEVGGKALTAAADIALAGFPKAREKFRNKIAEKVDAAKKRVNELADALKAGVTKLLNALGSILKGALSLLEKAYLAAVDAVTSVVNGVIKAARAWISAIAEFAVIASHVASDPGRWLRNLGAALIDGVRNHVWPALVKAVKDWFRAKVEEVVGVGKMIIDILHRGGISFGKIVAMAWTAIKESLPGILIRILIEKLVAMLVPVAGALSVIIDGLRAAWAAAGRILAAFQKFIVFLKAVKSGSAGPKFGDLVGAAAIAVIDFVANFVLVRLKGAGSKVGGTLRKMAEKFLKAIKKVAGVVKRGVVTAAKAFKRVVVAGARAAKRGVVAVGRGVANVARKLLPAVAKVGAVIRKGVAQVKRAVTKVKEKLFGKRMARKPKETREQKIARAITRTEASVGRLVSAGVSRHRMWLTLRWLQLRWRWKMLRHKPDPTSGRFVVEGIINPPRRVAKGYSALRILRHRESETVKLGRETAGELHEQYAQAIIQERLAGIAAAATGRPVELTTPGRTVLAQSAEGTPTLVREARAKGGRSSRATVRANVEMAMRKGESVGPFVRPDVRAFVPGIDPVTGKAAPSRDEVHIFEITTVLDFIEGNQIMAKHKQQQAYWTIDRALAAFPTARLTYTFIAPGRPTPDTRKLLQRIVAGRTEADQSRIKFVWRIVKWRR